MDMPAYKTALIIGAGEGLSGSLARLFAKNGLKVRNLQGGMMAWKGAGLPVTRDP